jgi:hypothetical protein
VRLPIASLFVVLLVTAAAAGAHQTKVLAPPLAPTASIPPTPAPLAPPINPGPLPAPRDGLSPLLAQPGPVSRPLPRTGPSYPSASAPAPLAPLDQQKVQTYRNDLLGQRYQLERQGVSPGSERFREIQQQLNQPTLR